MGKISNFFSRHMLVIVSNKDRSFLLNSFVLVFMTREQLNLIIGMATGVFSWNSLPTEILEFPIVQLKKINLDIEIRGS